jgi:hypothetical protein
MSDQSQQKGQLSPFLSQWADPKFQAMSWDEQKYARAKLYDSLMQKDPKWAATPAGVQIQAFNAIRDAYPPSFTDQKYDILRQNLEDPAADIAQGHPQRPALRFIYSTGVQMGMTGLLTRGIVNASKAISDTLYGSADRVNKFFGGYTTAPQGNNQIDESALLQRAIGGNKDGVKLAQYLQQKYEKPLSPLIPLIGGQTPTQLLGSALGYGTDLLATAGIAPATAGVRAAAPMVKMGLQAALTGTKGLGRGLAAEVTNIANPAKAPVEGATDTSHGVAETIKSVGTLWGLWAAQGMAFDMLGASFLTGAKQVGVSLLKATFGRGTAALPKAEAFAKTSTGEYTARAQALQRQFKQGVSSPVALDQLGPVMRDWEVGRREALQYSVDNPNAIKDNPVAAMRVGAQLMIDNRNSPIGISTVEDGPGTYRVRQSLEKGGKVLGEHLSLNETESVLYPEWERELDFARGKHDTWSGIWEETKSNAAKEQVKSYELRMNALNDSHPHFRSMRDSLAIVRGLQDRIAPEGAAKVPSEGAMLTYGEVGQIESGGMKSAKLKASLDPSQMNAIAKRGSLVPTDKPTRFSTVSGGDYNAAIIYSNPSPESVYQASLLKAGEYAKNGANAPIEDLAHWELRDKGFDAIEHGNGDVTSLYPRDQIKHVSDAVNKRSREYAAPPAAPKEEIGAPSTTEYSTAYKAPDMLGSERAKADWLMESVYKEGGSIIQKTLTGDYSLQMKGMPPVEGDLARVTDEFLARTTTPSHLRASLEAEGMRLSYDNKSYRIFDDTGHVIGVGDSPYSAMRASGYRPRLIDGRFGPQGLEVMPDGTPFAHTGGIASGSLADVYKFANRFMDVAAEEGKKPISATKDGKLSQGHDGAYSVEIPAWGIREKFGNAADAKEYLGGKYREYGNVQRLANERGFTFSYDAQHGFTLTGTEGTYSCKTMDEVGKVLSKVSDPAWAPGGKYETGFTIKESADATKMPADTEPSYRNTGKDFFDRSRLGQRIASSRAWWSEHFGQNRGTFDQFDRMYKLKGLQKTFTDVQAGERTYNQQHYVDARMAESVMKKYPRLNGEDWVVVKKMQDAVDPDARNNVLNDFGYNIKSPKRFQILDAANDMASLYDTVHNRTGQDPAIMLKDFSPRNVEFKHRNPVRYQDMEMAGPAGMHQLAEATHGGRVPDNMRFMSLNERVAEVDSSAKDENAITAFIRYSELANRWAYMVEPMKAFVKRVYSDDVLKIKDPRIVNTASRYMEEALHSGNSDALDLMRLEGKVGGQVAKSPAASLLKTLTGIGVYGFKRSVGLHIQGGNYALGSGFLGTEAMNNGFRILNEGGQAGLKELFEKGVFSGRRPIFEGFGDTSMGTSLVGRTATRLAQGGTFWIQNDHIMGKGAVYNAASWLFDRHVKPWFDGGQVGDFGRIFNKIKGFRLDEGAADQMEGFLKQGNYPAALHSYAMNMTDQITYQWRPEDQGMALSKGQVAKMWGQVMISPTSYAQALDRLASRGTAADRTKALVTYGKNTALLYGASRLAGLSGSNALPWKVINLRGGPLWQDIVGLTQQPDKKRLDFALKALENMAPVSFVVQAISIVKQFMSDNPWGGFLSMISGSSTPNMRMQSQKALESVPPISWIKQGARTLGNTFSFLNPPRQ